MNPDLVTLPFDHYQRYGAASALVSSMGGAAVTSVLEVGANRQRILKAFIPGAHFVFSDLEPQEPVTEGDDVFVQADATQLPFENRKFDAVVCLDVMEHIPPQLRARATQQMARVAGRIVIIGCPLDFPWVHDAEERANSVWERYFGSAYPWLEEHKEFGLVDPDVVSSALSDAGFLTLRFGQGDVDVWSGLMASHFVKEAFPELSGVVAAADRLYNESVFAGDRGARTYREFFVAVRDGEDYARLKASSFLNAEANLPAISMLSNLSDRLLPVVDRVRKAEQEWAATAAVTRELEDLVIAANSSRLSVQLERDRVSETAVELRGMLEKNESALSRVDSQLFDLAIIGREFAESAERLRNRIGVLEGELGVAAGKVNVTEEKLALIQGEMAAVTTDREALVGERHSLAARVVTLEARQRAAKWSLVVVAAACVIAAAFRMLS